MMFKKTAIAAAAALMLGTAHAQDGTTTSTSGQATAGTAGEVQQGNTLSGNANAGANGSYSASGDGLSLIHI